jgi:hypothetical protein
VLLPFPILSTTFSPGLNPFAETEIGSPTTAARGAKPNAPRYTSGVLAKYAKLVQGAETGAITNIIS